MKTMQLSGIADKLKKGGQKVKGMSKKKKIIFIIIALLLVAAILFLVFSPKKKVEKKFNIVQAQRGNVSVVISGTGTIKPIDEYQVTSLVKGEILEDTFEEGDLVEEGDLLYQIDSSDLENTLEKAQLGLQRSQLSYNQTMEDLEKLNVKSRYSGTITETYVKVGDSVNNGTKIADLIDKDTLILKLPFNAGDAATISEGSRAQVMLTNSFYTLEGTVLRVSSGSLVSADGNTVRTVEIKVQNPGAVAKGDMATAIVGDVACNGPGTFEYNLETTITAETSGKVIAMNYGKGDVISAGAVVAKLESSTSDNTRRSSELSLRDAQLSIENYNKQLENYQITAPISGTVLKKTSKAGDTLDNTNSSTVMAVIADMSTIIFEMSVDELDISKISVGQKVSVTADAVAGKPYSGYVDYVSVVGTTQNGVTTYPITVVVENPEGLIPGMNISAEIVVDSRQDVLLVPVSAVNRGNIVFVKDNGKATQTPEPSNSSAPQAGGNGQRSGGKSITAPEGFRAVRVETGLNDSNFVEIISGLSEGDEVYVPVTSSSGLSGIPGMGGMSGMGGGMPGGMGGGMPSGMGAGRTGGMGAGRTGGGTSGGR
ncbi:MAG: HlyD family efflux transporter periplasmic adaptor subunit [Ruminococcaceae bacterium]|nr:HlyD family efflux transporter periplasmic adaptor subunit [Oscillospiraceae bacterium]